MYSVLEGVSPVSGLRRIIIIFTDVFYFHHTLQTSLHHEQEVGRLYRKGKHDLDRSVERGKVFKIISGRDSMAVANEVSYL